MEEGTLTELNSEAVEELRPLAFAIAYRMVGSVSEAEDLVQEALIRVHGALADGKEIASPKAYLSAVTTRLAIDHLRSARVRREQYIGPWLPEPLLTDPAPGPAEHAERADSLSQAFLVVLESLSPVERAVFLLREVFGYEYGQIADAVGKSEDNCRQLAARARRHVAARRPRFDADPEHGRELLERFVEAAESGDAEGLKELLAADATFYSDGGGVVSAARQPLYGAARIAKVVTTLARKRDYFRSVDGRLVEVNGQPGWMLATPDGVVTDVVTVDVVDGRIQTIRVVRNPEKLAHIPAPA